jgi:outer membrane protein assembly factor BamB
MKQKSRFIFNSLLPAVLMLIISSCTHSGNWPQFRGPDGNMITANKNLPDTWGNDKNIKWTYDIQAIGWSSSVVWGNRVFITSTFPEKVAPAPQMGSEGPRHDEGGNREPGQNPPQGGQGPQQGADARPGQGPRPGQEPGGPRPEQNDTSYKAEIYRWDVTCVDLGTGKEIWKQTAFHGSPKSGKQQMNTYASETPVTDGKRVYAYFGMMGLYCYDMEGKLL